MQLSPFFFPSSFHPLTTPSMLLDLGDGKSLLDIPIQHGLYELDGRFRQDPGNAQFVI